MTVEGHAHHSRGLEEVVVERHGLGAADHFAKRYRHQLRRMVRNHLAELSPQNQLHRFPAESCRERAIERGRRPAALQVSEHDVARFLPC